MDQNTPRDDAAGAQPPAEPGRGDAAAWNQAPPQEQSQPAAGGGQDAAEHAAWSADNAYQQQAQQPAPPPASDTQAYAAPEPQSATYSEQPAAAADPQAQYAQQQYQQPQQQAYDQQAYAQQQAYDQQAYAQQQQQYQQGYQQPQQQQPQQQAYDQQAYDQQAYAQQQQYQQGYQQPQQQQPQYYDQSAYGQQPGYYDQSAYGQQQYQQQQQPGQPYAYAQPGQEQWPGQDAYWGQGEAGYRRSFAAVVAAFLLLTWGLAIGIAGAFVLITEDILGHLGDVTLSAEVSDLVTQADEQIVAVGGLLLIVGIAHVIGSIGVFAHRRWGRAFGLVLGVLGILAGVGIILAAVGVESIDVGLDVAMEGEEGSVAGGLFVLVTYLLIFLGVLIGRGHFKRKGVEG